MDLFLDVTFGIVFFSTLGCLIYLAYGLQQLVHLEDIESNIDGSPPLVSIIVPACNEEVHLEESIRRLFGQDYPQLEVILINDRSTDYTAKIAKNLQRQFDELEVVTIEKLPEGWMGKANALREGTDIARGEILVFTDADVHLEPTVLSRAVTIFQKDNFDHLSLIFRNSSPGWLLNTLIIDAGFGLLLLFRPWLAKRPNSKSFMGVGAFNMVRKSVYQRIGGHDKIKMHPVDDLMLGKIVKEGGYRQDCCMAGTMVTVPWYDSVSAMIDGLMKNVFSVVHYRLAYVPLILFAIFVATILPAWGLFFFQGMDWFFCLGIIVLRTIQFCGAFIHLKLPWWRALAHFVAPYVSFYIIVRAVSLTLFNDGINWRGQHYSLAELRRSKPLLF